MAAPNTQQNYPLATLYVGDLDPNVTEAVLYEKFSSVGQVMSIRVCRDQITRTSLGYAYVNFQQPADAERALDTLNFDSITGRPMRIMWSQRDPSLRKSGVGNVFIKNLDKSINNESLYDTFSAFGNILSCKIMTDAQGESKGFGFVHFETQEAADKAVAAVNNMMLNNKKVFVGKFLTKNQRAETNAYVKKKFTNVFVKNFGDLLNDEEFQELLSKNGEITSCKVSRDDKTGASKGYGFCNFKDAESAEKAVNELNGFQLQKNGVTKVLTVVRHQKKAERLNELRKKHEDRKKEKRAKYEGVNLYVKNLDDRVNDESLRREFEKFGTITSAKVMTNEKGESKGFGFVCFKGPEEATRAVSEMRGKIVGSKPLYVALAQLKEDRKNHLINQYRNYINSMRVNQQQVYVPSINAMYNPNVFPNVYQTVPRATPRWATTRPQAGSNTFQTYQMYAPIQSSQQPQQRARMNGPQVQMRPNTVNNRLPYPQMNGQTQFVRNQYMANVPPQQMQQVQPQQQQQQQPQGKRPLKMDDKQAINVPGQPPLTSEMLASAPLQDQKQMLGERLYPLIYSFYPDWAGKITGMLLEIDNAELIHMLESQELLREKVEEAFNVLKAHQTKTTA